MQLTDLIIAPPPTAGENTVAITGQPPASQTLAGLTDFSELFALLSPLGEEASLAEVGPAPAIPDGNILPGSGEILPVGAAPLAGPQLITAGLESADETPTPSSLPSPVRLPGQVLSPAPEGVAPLASQDRVPASASPALVAVPAKAENASSAPLQFEIRKLVFDLPLRATGEAASRPGIEPEAALPEQAGRTLPVADILRPAGRVAAQPAANATAPAPAPALTPATTSGEEQPQRSTSAPVSPPPQPQTTAFAAPIAAEGPRPPIGVQASESSQAPQIAQRHDFTQIVERLAEARETARPCSAQMQVAHREFGAVTMQFEITAGALKVALANAHTGFAPAVQAALAERAPMEAPRADAPLVLPASSAAQPSQHRQDAPVQSAAPGNNAAGNNGSGQNMQGQADSGAQHRQDNAPRGQAIRPNRDYPDTPEGDGALSHRSGRDAALFA
ncbi:hypothetical protein [Aurantiacibacter poecillastricola]|uniref:hypothetical protein n=1 Tax=Aurantiacibacter poecillastricola TaxID=3064385 RepID=UPI00273FBF26|nr:hypothetical protein [Aurantiacibacter sp. 219JJ12-13]MDP5263130.1 hypothetical protein [Aurantiacibacter sp. 219JJ12-13]